MARVLCINPWIYDFTAHNVWIEPLGLLTVAGVLRQAGHDVALIDCLDRRHPDAPAPSSPRDRYGCGHFHKVELCKPPAIAHIPRRWGRYGLALEVVESDLRRQPRPDAVLVTSAMTYWYYGPFQAVRLARACWPEVPVALGGVYATLCTDHARRYSGADAVLPGPGELTALDWVGQVTGDRRSLDVSPADVMPAHDLRRPQGYITVQTARGCPFHCSYCGVQRMEPAGFVPRSPERVVEEIAWCVTALDTEDVAFYDDALLFRAEQHLEPILDGLRQCQVRARLHTPNGLHARFVNRHLAEKMFRAGFVTLRLGLETVDPEQASRDGGKVNNGLFARAVEALFAAGFSPAQVAAYVLVARPGQGVEDVRATVRFAQSLGVRILPAEYSPIPGTPEWERSVEERCIAADADPLLHDKSTYPCARAPEWEALKQEIRDGNQRLIGSSHDAPS